MIINHQSQTTQPIGTQNNERVAVLLTGYGEVQSYRALSVYNQAATKYIASQFVPIPKWLYPLAGWFLALQDLYNFGVKHNHFMLPENEIFEKQRLGRVIAVAYKVMPPEQAHYAIADEIEFGFCTFTSRLLSLVSWNSNLLLRINSICQNLVHQKIWLYINSQTNLMI